MAENVCFASVLAEFRKKEDIPRAKKTTKYGLKTFKGREKNLNYILMINLLLIGTKFETKTDEIPKHIFCSYYKQNH